MHLGQNWWCQIVDVHVAKIHLNLPPEASLCMKAMDRTVARIRS